MKEQVSQFLYGYWNDVRAGRLAPKRFEIEPSSLASILPDTFVLELSEPGTARFRLAGTRICDAFGTEFRGTDFFELFGPDDRATLRRQVSIMANQGAVGVLSLEAETASGLKAHFEVTLLPLIHTHDKVERFLGSMAPDKAYAWFGTEQIVKQKLIEADLVWPDGRPHTLIAKSLHQAPFLPHVRNARIVRSDRRHFRVYDGGLSKPRED
jgi:hypothetical protein